MKRYNAAAGATLAAVPLPDGDVAIGAVTPSGGEPETETETPRYKKRSGKVAVRKDRPAPPSVLTLSVNTARGLVELRFPSKPDEATRAEMKAARFRWYGPAGCWYHKHTPENFAWAQQFVARHTTASPVPVVEPNLQGAKPDCIALPKDDPETKLRQIWNEKGVPVEKQEAILADITAKAQPGAMIGPFQIPPSTIPAWRQRFHK